MGLHAELCVLNSAIDDAKQSYMNNELMDGNVPEFCTEKDLQRHIDLCNYEKLELIKSYCDKEYIEVDRLNKVDQEIFARIKELKALLPKESHKCIGCPCLEYDYPSCGKCSFQESCLLGNQPYPNECSEGDCFFTFKIINKLVEEGVITKSCS